MSGLAISTPESVVLAVVAMALIWPISRIIGRAGFPRGLSLLALVPVLNVALLFYLALARWPALSGGSVSASPAEGGTGSPDRT